MIRRLAFAALALVLLRADMYQNAGNADLPAAQINLGIAAAGNPVTYDPLCDGRTTEAEIAAGTAHDCTAAINSAAAALINTAQANVQLQTGRYYLTGTISLLNGQTLIGAGRSKTFLRIKDTFNSSAQGVVVLGGTDFAGGAKDLTISFDQPATQTSRAAFQTIGSCTSASGGTGCKYPAAVLLLSGRARFQNLRIDKAWDGIATASVASINNPGGIGNSAFWLLNTEMSALNTGLWIDGPKDIINIENFHFWPFGIPTVNPLYDGVYKDGNTDCMRFGNADGANIVNVFCHGANIHFIDTVVPGLGAFAGKMTNVSLDSGGRLIVDTLEELTVANFGASSAVGAAHSTPPKCLVTINALSGTPRVLMSNVYLPHPNDTPICVNAGGFLSIEHARMINFVDKPTVLVNAGTLIMRDVFWSGNGATVRTMPVIRSLGGAVTLTGHSWSGPTVGGGGVVIELEDNGNHQLTEINAAGYGISFGCGPTTAGYCWGATPVGIYDLPAYPFAHTVTPTFTGATDFVPANKSTAGQWWLRGNKIEFWLREEFDTNAYTTGNNFILQTTMPVGASALGSSRTCAAQRTDKVTWTVPPRCAIGDNAGGTASDLSFYFPVSGGTITQMARADMPASTADFLFAISGWYPIR